MITVAGVKNRTKEMQTLTFNGETTEFEPGEVRILDSAMANHALTRIQIQHVKKDGKLTEQLGSIRPFEGIPLEEALKVAKVHENPDIVAARKRAHEKELEKKALTEEIMDLLKKDGWKSPQEETTNKGGRNK